MTTGAVVLRQPFGGHGKSSFGPGMKAGGPNYVAQFMDFADAAASKADSLPGAKTLASLCEGLRAKKHPDAERVIAAIVSYDRNGREEFCRAHDHFKLVGQDNFRRYRPLSHVRVRVHAADTDFEIVARVCAAHAAGCRVTVTTPPGIQSAAVALLEELTESWAAAIEFVEESDEKLAQAISERQADRVRYAAPERAPLPVVKAGCLAGGCVVSTPVSAEGRLEMLWYLREQSISIDYHRYGNLSVRAGEDRAPVM